MIPARLGSKRIKKKNLRLIDGLPLIQYIVNAAKASSLLDEIYITLSQPSLQILLKSQV